VGVSNHASEPCVSCVLITGVAGYIASHVVIEIVESYAEYLDKIKIIGIDNFHNSTPWHLVRLKKAIEYVLSRRNSGKRVGDFFSFYEADICNKSQIEEVMVKEKPEAVIHFAAAKYVDEAMENPTLYYYINVYGTSVLLDACVRHGVKLFVFSSSCAVYGDVASSELPVRETTPFGVPLSAYHHTKQVCEQMIEMFGRNRGLKSVSLRYFNPAGAHECGYLGDLPRRKAQNIFPALMRVIFGKEKFFVINGDDYPTRDGTCIRDYIHIKDLAVAHVLAMEYGMSCSQFYSVFNLGSGRGFSVKEIVEETKRTLKIDFDVVVGKRREGDASALYADYRRARDVMGWEPQHTLADMITSTYNFYSNVVKESPEKVW